MMKKPLQADPGRSETPSDKIDIPSIFVALVWGLAGLFVALTVPSAPAILLFIPAGFPLSVAFLAGAFDSFPGMTNPILLFAFPFQNLLVGYFSARLLRKHLKSGVFRRIFIASAGIGVLLYLFFIVPVINLRPNASCLRLQRAVEQLLRLQIEALPAELDAATYYRRAGELMAETDFKDIFGPADFLWTAPWKAEEYPEIAKWLKDNQDVLDLIDEGTRQEICKWSIREPFDDSIYPAIELYDPKLLQAVIADLTLSLGEYGLGESRAALQRTVRLLGHYYQRDALIFPIMAYVYEGSLHPLLREVLLADTSSGKFYETLIDRMIWLDLIAEKAIRYSLLYELRLSELWLYPASISPDFRLTLYSERETVAMVDVIRSRWNTLFRSDEDILIRSDQWLDSLEKAFFTPPYSPENEEVLKELEINHTRLEEDFSIPRYDSLREADLSGAAERRLTILLAALKLYRLKNGNYPDSMEQLVPDYLPSLLPDPYSERPFIYRKEAGQITIASNKADGTELSISFLE